MDVEEIAGILDKGTELREQIMELDRIYFGTIFTDDFSNLPILCLDDREEVKRRGKYLWESIEGLEETGDAFKEQMSAEGDEWKKYVSRDLAELPKERVIEQFNRRYKKLLNDYEKIRPQLEELLKE